MELLLGLEALLPCLGFSYDMQLPKLKVSFVALPFWDGITYVQLLCVNNRTYEPTRQKSMNVRNRGKCLLIG